MLSYSSNCDEGGDNHTELDDGGALVKPVHCSGGEGAGWPMGDDTKQDSLKKEKEELLREGFSNWTKRGFSMFINANENMGERTWRLVVKTW